MRHVPRRGDQGFSLIEILIVVAIVGVIATIVVPLYVNFLTRARHHALPAVSVAHAPPRAAHTAKSGSASAGAWTRRSTSVKPPASAK